MKRRRLPLILILILFAAFLQTGFRQADSCAQKQECCDAGQFRQAEDQTPPLTMPVYRADRHAAFFLENAELRAEHMESAEERDHSRRQSTLRDLRASVQNNTEGNSSESNFLSMFRTSDAGCSPLDAIISYIYHQDRLG